MTSTDKNPKRGRSIGFDSTRDCACLPLVDRTYVGTYVLCIRIYIRVYKKYIYIYILYIHSILSYICISRTLLRVRREKRSLVVTNRAEDTRGLRFEWTKKKERKTKREKYVSARVHSCLKTSRDTQYFLDKRNVRSSRMYMSASSRNRLRERFRRRGEIGPSCESSRTIFFHATVNSRAYTMSDAVCFQELSPWNP